MIYRDEALRLLKAFLDENAIPFMVIGGLAISVWAEERVTKDADVKVSIGDMDIAQFRKLVSDRFQVRPIPATPGITWSNLVVQAYLTPEIAADFLVAVLPYEHQAIQRAIRLEIAGVSVPVCRPEDLIIHKVLARRERDWEDIQNILIRQKGKLDQHQIVRTLTEMSEYLEDTTALERYKKLQQEFDP